MRIMTVSAGIVVGIASLACMGAESCTSPRDGGTMLANPEAVCWGSPNFRGKPFWPMFAKILHVDGMPPSPGQGVNSSWGLENLPLTQEYASAIAAHYFKAGIAKYRYKPEKNQEGKWIYCAPIPEKERILGKYTLRDAFGPVFGDFLYDGDWQTRWLWNPQKGNPFILKLSESRPVFTLDGEDRGDKEDFAKWVAAHPGFLGFSALEEFDSDSGNYKATMLGKSSRLARPEGDIRRDLERRFPLWKDRYGFIETMRRCWETEKRYHFGCDRLWPLYCNNHTLAHIGARLGAVGLIAETSTSQGSPWTWSGAYTRGASRQWGIPFAWYCATYYSGYKRGQAPGTPPVSGDNRWPRDGKFTAKRPAYCGASVSIGARQKLYGWLIGAAFIQDEPWTMLSASMENGKHCPSPYARAFNEVFVASRKADRGAPYTPIAFLTPLSESVWRGGFVEGLQDEKGNCTDLLNLPACYLTLQPVYEDGDENPMLHFRRRRGDEGCLFNSHFGEIWDVLTADSGQSTERFASVLSHYPAAFLVGSYRKGDLGSAALEAYVRGGGTLFVSADYVEEGHVSADFAGVSFGKGRRVSGERLIDEQGAYAASLDGLYELYEARPTPESGARAFLKDDKGNTVAYARSCGKGRVITIACMRAMPAMYFRTKYRLADKTHLALRKRLIRGEGRCDLLWYLFDRIQRETIPVKVDGDIQWGLGRNSAGWLLWLVNNKGVAKFHGEPADIDKSKTATVAVSLGRLDGMKVRDAESGTAIDAPGGTFKVDVPPGGWRLVSISGS